MTEALRPNNYNSLRNRLTAGGALALSVVALAGCALGSKKVGAHLENQIPPSYVVPEKKVKSVAENVASRLINLAKDRKIKIGSMNLGPAYKYKGVGSASNFTLPLSKRYFESKYYQSNLPEASVNIYAKGKLQDGMFNAKRVEDIGLSIYEPDGYTYDFNAGDFDTPRWTIAIDHNAYPTEPGYAAGVDSTAQLRPRSYYNGQVPLTEPALDDITHSVDRAIAFLEAKVVGP